MAPLFYFLASSLNVELVYIILKSLTQFVAIDPNTREFTSTKVQKVKIIDNGTSDDVTLELSKIKIKNYSDWAPSSGTDLFQNQYLGLLLDEEERKSVHQEDRLEINLKVQVTFYQMGLFMKTFSDFYRQRKVLHTSLSPKFNLE